MFNWKFRRTFRFWRILFVVRFSPVVKSRVRREGRHDSLLNSQPGDAQTLVSGEKAVCGRWFAMCGLYNSSLLQFVLFHLINRVSARNSDVCRAVVITSKKLWCCSYVKYFLKEERQKERKHAHTFSCKLIRLFVFVCGPATWSLFFVRLKCKKANRTQAWRSQETTCTYTNYSHCGFSPSFQDLPFIFKRDEMKMSLVKSIGLNPKVAGCP